MDKLESRLKQQRQAGTHALMTAVDSRRKRLSRLSKEMEEALAPRMPSRVRSTRQAALRIFAGLASEFPKLDSTNLHAYRKRLKQALYLAEISSAADPLARRLAAAFRKIHLAAGEWHDWQALALEAGRILPEHAKQDGLVPLLETLTEEALQKALGLCRRSAARFLKGAGAVEPYPRRKPVASDPGLQLGDEHRSLRISS
jgi:hypothetical protein